MASRIAWISDKDILHNPTGWRKVTIADSTSAGKVTTTKANKKVMSAQPDGSEGERDAGSDGLYEQGQLRGDTRLIYAYDGIATPLEFRVILL